MKKIIFPILVLFLIAGSSCQEKAKLTNEQRATIEKDVRDQFDKYVAGITQLDIDLLSEVFSKDEFVSYVSGRIGMIYGYSALVDSLTIYVSARERHRSEILDVRVTALAPDLAFLTQIAIWENWYKNGDYIKYNGQATYLWKKEQDGWKLIHAHESGQVIEENKSFGEEEPETVE